MGKLLSEEAYQECLEKGIVRECQDAVSVKEERQAVGNYINEYCVNMNHPGHKTGHERIRRYQCRLCMLALSKRLRQGYATEIIFDGQEDNTQ